MEDACTIMDQIIVKELVWNDLSCQMRADTQIEYLLPNGMTVVKTEIQQTFS